LGNNNQIDQSFASQLFGAFSEAQPQTAPQQPNQAENQLNQALI